MNEVYYDRIFPTLVVYTENKHIVDEKTVELSRQIIKEKAGRPFYSECYSTVNTFAGILELPEFFDIKNAVVNTVGGFCEANKINTERIRFTCSWLNAYNNHGYQDLHSHPDSILSGVFYIKSNEEKDLVFQAPWHFFQPCTPEYTELNLNNCHNVEYESVVGRCYVFPSHLMHRTLPATSERISLSFNLAYSQG
jgi:uncharacterized protein (TIGR02466 family)